MRGVLQRYFIEIQLVVNIVVLEQFDFTVALNPVQHSSLIGITKVSKSKPLDTPEKKLGSPFNHFNL